MLIVYRHAVALTEPYNIYLCSGTSNGKAYHTEIEFFAELDPSNEVSAAATWPSFSRIGGGCQYFPAIVTALFCI